MAISSILSNVVLVITTGVLLYVALTDLKEFKIRNDMVLVLVGLFVIHALLSGRWTSAHWNVVLAAFLFLVMLYFYQRSWMGGGDVKILSVGFLWVGIDCAFVFAVLLSIFAMLHAGAAKLGWTEAKQVGERQRIPFAPSVAAALIACFVLGCLAPGG
jgi:prepilin peptidase CpaA